MYKINIHLNEVYLRLKQLQTIKRDNEQKVYLQIKYQQRNKWLKIDHNNKRIQFLQQPQPIADISHVVYVKNLQIQQKTLKYQLLLIIESTNDDSSNKTVVRLKYAGQCQIEIKDYVLLLKQNIDKDKDNQLKSIIFQQKIKLNKCPDNQAYLKFTIQIQQLQEFRAVYQKKSITKTQTVDDDLQYQQSQHDTNTINDHDIILQQQLSILQQTKTQHKRITTRNQRLSQQITHLLQQNKQLSKQINSKKQSIRIDQQLKQDKLDMLIDKKIKVQQVYKNIKQSVGRVFNVLNQYGRVDVIEQVSNLLQKGQQQQSNK